MLSFEFLGFVLLIAALGWVLYESRRASEQAMKLCQRTCRDLNVQFLDQSIALSGLGLGRDSHGRLRMLRQFRFEFSTTGTDRRQGRATMLGPRVESVLLEHPDGTTLITPHGDAPHRLN